MIELQITNTKSYNEYYFFVTRFFGALIVV